MARGIKRKAMEEMTPNSQSAIDFVRATGDYSQQPQFIGRIAMSVKGAVSWLLGSFYIRTTHQDADLTTDRHVQIVRTTSHNSTSIKRLKTSNSTSALRTQPPHEKPRSRSETYLHSSAAEYRGGVGPVDVRGCTTEEDLEQCVDNFWLPQDWTKPKSKHQQQKHAPIEVREREPLAEDRLPDIAVDQDEGDLVMRDSFQALASAHTNKEPSHQTFASTTSMNERKERGKTPAAPSRRIASHNSATKREPSAWAGSSSWTAYSLSKRSEWHENEKYADKLSKDIGSLLLTEVDEKASSEQVPKDDQLNEDTTVKVKDDSGLDVDDDQELVKPEIKKPLKSILKKESKYESRENVKKVDPHLRLRESEDKKIKREASARQREKQEREAAAKARKEARLYRRQPNGPLVKRLNTNWTSIVKTAMSRPGTITTSLGGTPLHQKDFGTLLGGTSWLNDEIINTYIEWVVDAANHAAENEAKAAGEKVSSVPKFIAHNSFFYESLKTKGPQGTARLMKRKKAPGLSLLEVDSVFVPICKGAHWTLGVVRPFAKTIEYFDSMGGSSAHLVKLMRDWLSFQLGDAYVAEDWTEPRTRCAVQHNGYDCGVFVCTNAFCVTAGLDTFSYLECHMAQMRQNIAAILINRGFVGDFAWSTQL
ncbi:Ulp1 protease family protein [Phlyctema vagabunda]|uniref:Ulp1 protease family protein n=1 Tax=Phlyctema vagabunda TaxID=108571 RepID=A0ABR4PCI3_9HELO